MSIQGNSECLSILIAGAGIGGLAAAANLISAGHRVKILEAAPELGEVGAGIQMSANAVKILYNLGLKGELDKICVRPSAYNFRVHSTGELIQTMPLGETHEKRFGAPYIQLHRADIHDVLARKVKDLDPDCIELGATVKGFEESDDGVTVFVENGKSYQGDILIGADGIKSAVRRQLFGDQAANYTGQVAWRIVVPTDRLPDDFMEQTMTVWCGPRSHAVIYYLRGGDLINFVGLVAMEGWEQEGWTIKCPWEDMKADFAGWHPMVQQILDAADKDECYRWALNNRQALPKWSEGRVTLLGDSCHPTLPYLAQGAVMAIEDGAVLTRALAQESDHQAALQLYERNRIERTTRIVNESTANATLFQHDNVDDLKAAFAARDIDKERTSWLYSYDALSVDLV